MKYNTLKDVLQAQQSGELSEPLILDNDNSTIYVDDICVYRGLGYEIREEALTLLGIKWEHC